jgi:hypothetical protein
MPKVLPGFSEDALLSRDQQRLESIVLTQASGSCPVDERVATSFRFAAGGRSQGVLSAIFPPRMC